MKSKLLPLVSVLTLGFAGIAFANYEQMIKALANMTLSAASIPQPDNGQSSLKLVGSALLPAGSNTSNTVQLNVRPISQEPELYNGCEVTSLSMLLSTAGHPVDKTQLANSIKKDPSPEVKDNAGNTISWGDPNIGFVGDVTGDNRGYGVYHGPIDALLNQYLPGKAVDLTGHPFNDIIAAINAGKPVITWTTVNFVPTSSWVTWQGPAGPVRATLDEHCVLLVGYNDTSVLINDPLDGSAAKAVDKDQFIQAWKQLGSQAVTYKS